MPLGELREARPALLVTSPSLRDRATRLLPGVHVAGTEVVDSALQQTALPSFSNEVGVVIGLGGGSVMDVARLRARQLERQVVCIPTLLSTDACLTATTALREEGAVRYVPSAVASRVIVDESLLLAAPARLHALGACDALSITTALEDWRLAPPGDAPTPYSASIAAAGRRICQTILDAEDALREGTAEGLHLLLGCLWAEVLLCNTAGTSRVEEGGEHYFAYCLESKLPGLMHGEMVGLGILICCRLQGQPSGRLRRFMTSTGIAAGWRDLPRQALIEAIVETPDYVQEQNLPYSVWQRVRPDRDVASRLLDAILQPEAVHGT